MFREIPKVLSVLIWYEVTQQFFKANWAPANQALFGAQFAIFLANWAPANWAPANRAPADWAPWRQIGPRQIGPRQIGPLGGKLGPLEILSRQIGPQKILGAANWALEIWVWQIGPRKFGCGKLGPGRLGPGMCSHLFKLTV